MTEPVITRSLSIAHKPGSAEWQAALQKMYEENRTARTQILNRFYSLVRSTVTRTDQETAKTLSTALRNMPTGETLPWWERQRQVIELFGGAFEAGAFASSRWAAMKARLSTIGGFEALATTLRDMGAPLTDEGRELIRTRAPADIIEPTAQMCADLIDTALTDPPEEAPGVAPDRPQADGSHAQTAPQGSSTISIRDAAEQAECYPQTISRAAEKAGAMIGSKHVDELWFRRWEKDRQKDARAHPERNVQPTVIVPKYTCDRCQKTQAIKGLCKDMNCHGFAK